LTAPSLTVIGKAPKRDLRRTAMEIERFRVAIRALAPTTTPMSSPVPMVAVVFRDNNAMTPFKPRDRGKPVDNVAAYFRLCPTSTTSCSRRTTIASSPIASSFTSTRTFSSIALQLDSRCG